MKLDFETIKSITRGAISTEIEGGYIRFRRMTDRQADAFCAQNKGFLIKTYATASVYMDFMTDSELVRLHYGAVRNGSSRNNCNFDVLVNSNLYMHITDTPDSEGGIINISLDGKENRVQIFFPNLANPGVEYMEIKDGAFITPNPPKKTILCHGDSITQGYDATFPCSSYVNLLARHFDAEVINQAIGGARFNADVVEKISKTPDFITVAYGTNDWSSGDENFERNVKAFLQRLCSFYPTTTVYVILPIWRKDNDKITLVGTFKKAVDYIRKTANEFDNIKVIEGDILVPHNEALFWDGYLHPNDLGFKFYADNLIKELK